MSDLTTRTPTNRSRQRHTARIGRVDRTASEVAALRFDEAGNTSAIERRVAFGPERHPPKGWREEVAFIAERLEKDAEAKRLNGAREEANKERDGVRRTLTAARDGLVPLAACHERASTRVRLLSAGRDLAALKLHEHDG